MVNNINKTIGTFEGERALFHAHDLTIEDSLFQNGESPLKHSKNLNINNTTFNWKYPIWYSENVIVSSSTFTPNERAGMWYTNNSSFESCQIDGPKNFRRCNNLTIKDTIFTNALETLWECNDVKMINVKSNGDYFGMNSQNVTVDNFTLEGNYPFDGGKNIKINNSTLISKDAFWNCENVEISNSYISGEYFAWNSENVTLINCTIESLQGFCFIKNLKMINCVLKNTTLAFEYVSNVDAEITTEIGSVLNPISGTITAPEIETLIVEKDFVDPSKTKIVCKAVGKTEEVVEWRRTN